MSRTPRHFQDTRIDVKVRLAGLWAAMLFVFAYVDIFGLFRADVLEAALDGQVAATGLAVDQVFLAATTVYITIPSLMVVLSLALHARLNRILNLVLSPVYASSILVSCVGEEWAYYLLGSAVEVVLLGVLARAAWTWPAPPGVETGAEVRAARPGFPG